MCKAFYFRGTSGDAAAIPNAASAMLKLKELFDPPKLAFGMRKIL